METLSDNTIVFTAGTGNKLKISAYGQHIIRLQSAALDQAFFSDDHYEMVESHDWREPLRISATSSHWQVSPSNNPHLQISIAKDTLQATFTENDITTLSELQAPQRVNTTTTVQFIHQPDEHFTGLGHSFYGRESSIDLKGQRTGRNYGTTPIEQAPLIVPFYLSNKGYGIFLNSTFANEFSFGHQNEYSITIDDSGFSSQMDYFYIGGGTFPTILNNYTQLTGRPRLPAKAMFGLQLSDKGHDHNSSTPSNETWWKNKISQHREAGYPLDHVVNDNRWRAAGGKRCESKLAWDKNRYPDPAKYQQWLSKNGLVTTLDFNRCIARKSDGWQPAFNLPDIRNIEFPNSAPDLTNEAFRQWFWQVFQHHALIPEKGFPGDALWIDEFDEQGGADKKMILHNGRSSAEMRNYWFFLIAKALVAEGWDKSNINKRPFVWVRGMTAGAQRYATLWSGDIYPNNNDFKSQVRAMQLAGLSGFPFWGHDAGGFYDWKTNKGPDESLYQRWALAFGSFAPIWKPHGMGQSRWPLDRPIASQNAFHHFAHIRYELMPYIYSAAHQASSAGIPIARAMVIDYQNEKEAWQYDLQYMWGDSILVAPVTDDTEILSIWLPKGRWYKYGSNEQQLGDTVIKLKPALATLPLYVKAGAIIPRRAYAKSTKFIDKTRLFVDIYTGNDGNFTLIEDDDSTQAYQTKSQQRHTKMSYKNKTKQLVIQPAKGTFNGAVTSRDLLLNFFGLNKPTAILVNGQRHNFSYKKGIVNIQLPKISVSKSISIEMIK